MFFQLSCARIDALLLQRKDRVHLSFFRRFSPLLSTRTHDFVATAQNPAWADIPTVHRKLEKLPQEELIRWMNS